ncbi:MAG: ribosome maturation factor RimM [Phototrophicales bacterium]|nr:MAG: 16S rRNA processing protein RimM [Phototrophicales bacterium]RMG71537.1 MAG: 16S rRNA processing protein RimM [Chloroflexota bacterium]
MDQNPPPFLLIGEILRPHGVRGEIKIRLLTDYPDRIKGLPAVYLGTTADDTKAQPYRVKHMRMHQGYGLLTLHTIHNRDDAERLRGLFVMIRTQDAIPLEDDEIYLYQLIGMRVETQDGHILGIIKEVLETGANDVYIIDSEEHGEILIPVTDETIVETDTDRNCVTVNLPEGLI